jgi:DNA-binding transcriptional LysR family regulator
MELHQLESFLVAADKGSFRQAAVSLHLSQPSVSTRIQKLEEHLGVPLFHRAGRGVRLTEMGKAFLPYAESALRSLREGREVLATGRNAPGGLLTIAAARNIGTYTLPAIVERLRQKHPDIKAHITVGRSRDVLAMVVAEQAQVGFARELRHEDVSTTHLYDEEVVLVTHPDHRFAMLGAARLAEVAQEPFILYDPGSAYFRLIQTYCRREGIQPRVEMRLDSIDATKHMVELGIGISFLPRSAIRREVERGGLRTISLGPENRVALQTALLMRLADSHPPQVLALLEVLSEMYGAKFEAIAA